MITLKKPSFIYTSQSAKYRKQTILLNLFKLKPHLIALLLFSVFSLIFLLKAFAVLHSTPKELPTVAVSGNDLLFAYTVGLKTCNQHIQLFYTNTSRESITNKPLKIAVSYIKPYPDAHVFSNNTFCNIVVEPPEIAKSECYVIVSVTTPINYPPNRQQSNKSFNSAKTNILIRSIIYIPTEKCQQITSANSISTNPTTLQSYFLNTIGLTQFSFILLQ